MDLENAGNYKYYKCRSLLACDTGGTVYDTSRCEDSAYKKSILRCADESKSESGQSQNIIYIVDAENECESEKKSLVDLTTHLDDDEFNDFEMHSNVSCEHEDEIIQYVVAEDEFECFNPEEEECSQNGNFNSFSTEKDVNGNSQDLVHQCLVNNDSFETQDSEHYEDLNNLNSIIYFQDTHNNVIKEYLSEDKDDQEEINFSYYSSSSQSKSDSFDLNNLGSQEINEYKYYPSIKTRVVSNKMHTHKRKQIYNIKDDSQTELLSEDKAILTKSMSFHSKSKKKRSAYNKENQRDKMQYQRKNPFANLKMSSILKHNKKQTIKRIKNHCKQQRRESITSSNDENFTSGNSISNDEEVLMCKTESYQINYFSPFNSKNDVLEEIDAVMKLNSEFANADYLEYVQPRERIVESNNDKLLTPTIEIEFPEFFKSCNMKQFIKEKQKDCNGNEVNFQGLQKMNNSKSALSPNEIAERELFLKSAYAKKLGYENYFNTSNDAVINEILFDRILDYQEIKLDINLIMNKEIYCKENQFLDKSFSSISCTLLESLNEFNRFGGFVEENYEEPNQTKEDSDNPLDSHESVPFSEVDRFQKEDTNSSSMQELKEKENGQINSNFTFNFLNKSNLLNVNYQSRYNSLEYITNRNVDTKRSPASLIIKIKRINDENNEYAIDDSNKQSFSISEKKIATKFVKNVGYECYDCSEKFRTKRILRNHVSENHRGPYDTECEICHMKFRKSSAHKKHQPWCQKNVSHKCDICDKVYCYRASLLKHLQTHKKLFKNSFTLE